MKEEELKTIVDVKIGSATSRDPIRTDPIDGRAPLYNFFKQKEIQMDKNIGFASDMRVTLFNASDKVFGDGIGSAPQRAKSIFLMMEREVTKN